MFGDVNLQDAGINGGEYGAGAGGWPTVRYFNAQTGYKGAPYKQKTSKSMCDELGDMEYMRAYIDEQGKKPCNVNDLADCSDKDKTFIDNWKVRSGADISAEITRLEKLATGKAKPDIQAWIKQRIFLLKELGKIVKSEL